MITLREHYDGEEREASAALDMRRAGFDVPDTLVTWALFVLGDGVGIVSLAPANSLNLLRSE